MFENSQISNSSQSFAILRNSYAIFTKKHYLFDEFDTHKNHRLPLSDAAIFTIISDSNTYLSYQKTSLFIAGSVYIFL